MRDPQLESELLARCANSRLFVRDIRVWNTGNRIVNALVAGIVPYFRVILLSRFTNRTVSLEMKCWPSFRHEAGHLRLWHLPTRIGFIALPLTALAIDEKNPLGLLSLTDGMAQRMGASSWGRVVSGASGVPPVSVRMSPLDLPPNGVRGRYFCLPDRGPFSETGRDH